MHGDTIRQRLAASAPNWRHLVAANIAVGGIPFSEGNDGNDQNRFMCCAGAWR